MREQYLAEAGSSVLFDGQLRLNAASIEAPQLRQNLAHSGFSVSRFLHFVLIPNGIRDGSFLGHGRPLFPDGT